MNTSRQKYLRRFLWFSSCLVVVLTAAMTYSIYISQKVHYGDSFDQAEGEMHSQNAWALTRAITVGCIGLFIVGSMILAGAWVSHPTPDSK